MSATEIVWELKKRNPDTFDKLSCTTVREWITTTEDGEKQWSDAVIKKVKQGNNPGHSKGGQRGDLVSTHIDQKTMRLTSTYRWNIQRSSRSSSHASQVYIVHMYLSQLSLRKVLSLQPSSVQHLKFSNEHFAMAQLSVHLTPLYMGGCMTHLSGPQRKQHRWLKSAQTTGKINARNQHFVKHIRSKRTTYIHPFLSTQIKQMWYVCHKTR
jgi:hypothetical protein